jgi:uncharacterized protein YbjT (DUF2867 family)
MIGVIGASGNTGRAVVKELQKLGHNPICIVRSADKAREVLGTDVTTAIADLTDSAALEKALHGVTSLFVVTGHNPQMAEQQNNILDAALKAGTKYLVRVSGGKAMVGRDAESVVGRAHYAIEEKLRDSKIGWVILRPGMFMQNVLGSTATIKNDNKLIQPFAGDLPIAFTDVRDTAAVGARILIDPMPHAGKTYELTGAPTSFGEFAEEFSRVLGKKITYVATTPEQAEQALKARKLPDWLVSHLVTIAKLAAAGGFSSENTETISSIAKRAPLSTRQFVEDHRGLFS